MVVGKDYCSLSTVGVVESSSGHASLLLDGCVRGGMWEDLSICCSVVGVERVAGIQIHFRKYEPPDPIKAGANTFKFLKFTNLNDSCWEDLKLALLQNYLFRGSSNNPGKS